jgi:hypothetical protein
LRFVAGLIRAGRQGIRRKCRGDRSAQQHSGLKPP